MRVRRFLHILLLAGVIILLWQVIATWRRPLPESALAAPGDADGGPVVQPSPRRAPRDGKQFAEAIADKDLFSPSRSRALEPMETTPQASTPPPSHLQLIGVFLSPNREEAIFRDSSQGGKAVRVRKGESLGAYRLNDVSPLRVTLAVGQDGDEVTLPLVLQDSGAAGKAPRLLPAAPRAGGAQPRHAAGPAAPAPPGAFPPGIPDESGVRQDILRLQQRLRQIRQKAVREQTQSADDGANTDEDEGGDEE